nr:hypothetical protein [uncultured Roseateles sp.]
MKSPRELHEKYGIPCVERTKTYPPKKLPRPGEENLPPDQPSPALMAAAKEIMATHRDVLRALAKR